MTSYDLTKFDAIEVNPVAGWVDEDGDTNCNVCDEDDPNLEMWSVYLHLKEGGVEWIADCATKEDAYLIAEALERAFPQLNRHGQWCDVKQDKPQPKTYYVRGVMGDGHTNADLLVRATDPDEAERMWQKHYDVEHWTISVLEIPTTPARGPIAWDSLVRHVTHNWEKKA
jgi:hypothetical protein